MPSIGMDRRSYLEAVGAGVVGTGFAGTALGQDAISVGHLSPFSGGLGWIGPNAQAGVETALADINDAGVLGSELSLNRQDSETNPQAAISAFETLNSAGVNAIVGPSSTVMPSLVEPAKQNGLAIVSPMSGTIQLDDVGGEWIWRTVPSDSIGGRAQAQYAWDELDVQEMALAFKNDKGSQSFSAAVGEYFQFLGGSVVTEVALDPNADSYRSEVQTLADSGAQVVSMTAATEVTSLFLKNYTELGAEYDLFLSNDVITQDFVDQMGTDVMSGMLGQSPAPGPANDQFVESYKQVHGQDQSPGVFSNAAYDAINLIALAFQKEGEATRQAIPNHLGDLGNPPGTEVSTFSDGKAALENGEEVNYEGAANPQNFDDTGDPLGPFHVVEVQDGSWTPIQTYSAEELAQEDG